MVDKPYDVLEPAIAFRAWRIGEDEKGPVLRSSVMGTSLGNFSRWLFVRRRNKALRKTGISKLKIKELKQEEQEELKKYGKWLSKISHADCPVTDIVQDSYKKSYFNVPGLAGDEIPENTIVTVNGKSFYIHKAPHIDCECGIYTYNDFRPRSLLKQGPIYGAVKLWGKVLRHPESRGWRAEHVEILALAMPNYNRWCYPFKYFKTKKRLKKLSQRYEVPIVKSEELPEFAKKFGQPLMDMRVDLTGMNGTRMNWLNRVYYIALILYLITFWWIPASIQPIEIFTWNFILYFWLCATFIPPFRKKLRLDK